MAINKDNFEKFANLRQNLEAAYWYEAVGKLTREDQIVLEQLISDAWNKLNGRPVQIPHDEHKKLHLVIYSRINNSFVTGILEAYWEAYEAIGLNVFTDYNYLCSVWQYHEKMVDSIVAGDYTSGYKFLVEHTELLADRLDQRIAN